MSSIDKAINGKPMSTNEVNTNYNKRGAEVSSTYQQALVVPEVIQIHNLETSLAIDHQQRLLEPSIIRVI